MVGEAAAVLGFLDVSSALTTANAAARAMSIKENEPEGESSASVLPLQPRTVHVPIAAPTVLASTSPVDDEALFRLQVLYDMQLERELLYKVAVVFLAISLAMILREWLLWWMV